MLLIIELNSQGAVQLADISSSTSRWGQIRKDIRENSIKVRVKPDLQLPYRNTVSICLRPRVHKLAWRDEMPLNRWHSQYLCTVNHMLQL